MVLGKVINAYNSMPNQRMITNSWNARQIAAANAAKISKLSRQVYINRGELKVKHNYDFSTTMANGSARVLELTLVSQGTDIHQRTGNHIYCKGYNVRGYVFNPLLDVYVVQSKNGVVPGYGDFQNYPGGFLYGAQAQEFRVLSTLKPRFSFGTSDYGLVSTRKRLHMSTYFNGTAAGNGVRNRIYLVVKNDTGAVASFHINMELYFRDK